ncbi:MAG: glycosyltransferase family 4 protein [Saprospiraceae bacterium]|nr:glycosyltransferase family 4 protein [Saprospiraceae bacterium]
MNILVDLYKLKDINTGLGQFSIQFAKALVSHPQFNPDHFTFLKGTEMATHLQQYKTISPAIQRRYLSFLNRGFGLWHSLHQFPSFIPDKNSKWLLTIHDLNFLIEKNPIKQKKYLGRLIKNVNRADCITCISKFTQDQLTSHLDVGNKRTEIIPNGVDLIEFPGHTPKLNVEGSKFFFSIGVFEEKKNFEVLLPMMHFFKNHLLILAGNCETSYGRKLKELIGKLRLERQVILTGTISDADKYWYLCNMDALLFPSKAEGFGIPVIEAMCCGKPVVLSSSTALPETGGTIAAYFDHFEPEHMAKIVQQHIQLFQSDPDTKSRESIQWSQRFSWKESISKYFKLYQELS